MKAYKSYLNQASFDLASTFQLIGWSLEDKPLANFKPKENKTSSDLMMAFYESLTLGKVFDVQSSMIANVHSKAYGVKTILFFTENKKLRVRVSFVSKQEYHIRVDEKSDFNGNFIDVLSCIIKSPFRLVNFNPIASLIDKEKVSIFLNLAGGY